MSEELKSCPFCGGPAELKRMNGGIHAKARCRVNGCHIQTPILTPEMARTIWNHRHDQ